MVIAAAIVVLLIGTWLGSGEGANICNVDSSELEACRPAVTGDNPPPPNEQCCTALHQVNLPCLCQYKSKLPSLRIDPKEALALPAKCVNHLTKCESDVLQKGLKYNNTVQDTVPQTASISSLHP
ncbi:hypothetical protein RJT34_10821 [Clitoria ternatea]|uniref:Bifunctional inhibitor/plant lipid transfer protein/seed storage helical domain-containing protein n=1 Tax=Clitoria ternatea TaxID=43366 RepID=A0AAN9PHW1_CLITE